MKKGTAAKAKQVIATLTISAAISLPIAAQDRSGYISSTGRTDTQTTAEATTDNESGNGTLGSGNLTAFGDGGVVVVLWNRLGEII